MKLSIISPSGLKNAIKSDAGSEAEEGEAEAQPRALARGEEEEDEKEKKKRKKRSKRRISSLKKASGATLAEQGPPA